MADYGHDLQFGTFITPSNRDPESVVALAQLSEAAGIDLVTFQDHPYQPGFLDTWTLLSWVAARTERVHLAGNVLNLPLRPPAVLARAVASLDLLSGGRIELGLGAGGFWDAIEAMGGRRLTPGQGVDALGEAIDIIRGVWDADERRPLRVPGTYYRVDGAKRGPAAAHDVPIWLGAYKPRMLRLTGAKADGWLPSLGYIQPHELAAANTVIDDAATAAGRDPREVRRLLNLTGASFGAGGGGLLQGAPAQWVDQLLPLALEDGISTFILGTDDPTAIETFAQEVAPALREAVAAERATAGTATGAVRSARALALRHPGIDYEALPASLAAIAVEPGDRGYARVRSTYVRPGSPGLVLRCATPQDVVDALAFARVHDVPLAVRSGGHGISGRSTNDGGIVLDVSAMSSVEVIDRERRVVRVGAGARWGDVAAALAPHGLAISSGDYGDVGVGGLATAGGQGFLGRSYGLTLDHVLAADVVLADGAVVRADAEHHPDLFWGLRGAGGNLGVVTSFDIEAAEVGDVVLAVVVYDASDAQTLLARWGAQVEASPRELTAFLSLVPARRGSPAIAQAMIVWADDDAESAVRAIEPFLDLAPVLQQQAQITPYAAVVPVQDSAHDGQAGMLSRSALVEHLDATVTGVFAELLGSTDVGMLQVRAVGGAVNDVDPAATAYAHRTQNFSLLLSSNDSRQARVDPVWDRLGRDAIYLSFETGDRPGTVELAFPPATLARLRQVKRRYDPQNVFRWNFPVEPAAEQV
ncbi:LLM class flavin-dependent oxidoreductase [Cellulomonas hominis]